MRMCTVTSIDDDRISNLCCISSSAFDRMTHNNSVASHGLYSQNSITQAFALYYARRRGRDVYYISTQIFASQLEGCAGTGTGRRTD